MAKVNVKLNSSRYKVIQTLIVRYTCTYPWYVNAHHYNSWITDFTL